jgi:ABC-type nitrate/sulfonate/bicarbonate transport system permease component
VIVLAILQTSAWAVVALCGALPVALLCAWSLRAARDASLSLSCVRFLALLPIAAMALALGGTHAWLGWWTLGAFAPLTLALRDVLRCLDPREPQAALALGLSETQVVTTIVVPVLARPVAVALTRTLARLVGEAGLFAVVSGAPVLGASAWSSPTAALALGATALWWAGFARFIEVRS